MQSGQALRDASMLSIRRMSRDLRFAAWLLVDDALGGRLVDAAYRSAQGLAALSSSPYSASVTADLVRVRSSALTDLLRRRRRSFWRFRLIWLRMLAIAQKYYQAMRHVHVRYDRL